MARSIYKNSLYVEKTLQHSFLARLYERVWENEDLPLMEVSTAEIDNSGYDVVISIGSITRHIQLKSSKVGGRTSSVPVNLQLAKKPSGCVVWYEYDPATLDIQNYRFFGNRPGEGLPDISSSPVAKNTRANAKGVKSERPNIRRIKQNQFKLVKNLDELLDLLFGSTEKVIS